MTPDLHQLASRVERTDGASRELDALRRIIEELHKTHTAHDCWIWPRTLSRAGRGRGDGRGRCWLNGKLFLAHRAVWTIAVGPIPSGAFLCHRCDNPPCVNPSHLYVGTARTNGADMSARKRTWAHRNPDLAIISGKRIGAMNDWAGGEGNPKAKLTVAQVSAIKVDRRPTRFVAHDYGVNRTTIQRIRRGAAWI